MAKSAIGDALRDARTRAGLRQRQIGELGHITNRTVCDVEVGRRPLAPDVTRRIVSQIDDGRLIMAAAEDITAGAESPWLDGPAADLSRVTAWVKTLEEMREAMEAGERALSHVCRTPSAASDEDLASIKQALGEFLEALTAGKTVVAVACREYGISYRQLWIEHRRDLYRRGYWAGNGRSER